MLLLGIDLGSSSVKASVIDGESGKCLASEFYPKEEMKIIANRPGWAEQDPEEWWENLKLAISGCISKVGYRKNDIGALGISTRCTDLLLSIRTAKFCVPQ
jgi:xylulokinase